LNIAECRHEITKVFLRKAKKTSTKVLVFLCGVGGVRTLVQTTNTLAFYMLIS
jgi:hypothetical protein